MQGGEGNHLYQHKRYPCLLVFGTYKAKASKDTGEADMLNGDAQLRGSSDRESKAEHSC